MQFDEGGQSTVSPQTLPHVEESLKSTSHPSVMLVLQSFQGEMQLYPHSNELGPPVQVGPPAVLFTPGHDV